MQDSCDNRPVRCKDRLLRRKRTIILSCSMGLAAVSIFLAVYLTLRNDASTSSKPSSSSSSLGGSSDSTLDGSATSTYPSTTTTQFRPSPSATIFPPSTSPFRMPTAYSSHPTLPTPHDDVVDHDSNVSPDVSIPSSGPLSSSSPAPSEVTYIGSFDLLEAVPHDETAFTQGLEVISSERFGPNSNARPSPAAAPAPAAGGNTDGANVYLLESTGMYGSSTIRLVELATGTVYHQINLNESYFGEGCTLYRDETTDAGRIVVRVVQVTWTSGTGFVYETSLDDPPARLVQVGHFDIDTVSGEGWGISYLPHRGQFIVSDGTEFLHFWELRGTVDENGDETFVFDRVETSSVTRRFEALADWAPVDRINELEWDPSHSNGDTVLANIWQQDHIVRIRLSDGKVTHQYDLSSLDRPPEADVLNGIAAVLDSSTSGPVPPSSTVNQFWVTGKLWPHIYRIRLVD